MLINFIRPHFKKSHLLVSPHISLERSKYWNNLSIQWQVCIFQNCDFSLEHSNFVMVTNTDSYFLWSNVLEKMLPNAQIWTTIVYSLNIPSNKNDAPWKMWPAQGASRAAARVCLLEAAIACPFAMEVPHAHTPFCQTSTKKSSVHGSRFNKMKTFYCFI